MRLSIAHIHKSPRVIDPRTLVYMFFRCLTGVLAYGCSGLHFARRGCHHEASVSINGTQDHSFRYHSLELARLEVGDEKYLLAYEVLGLVILGYSAHDSASAHAVVNAEFEQFVGLVSLQKMYP